MHGARVCRAWESYVDPVPLAVAFNVHEPAVRACAAALRGTQEGLAAFAGLQLQVWRQTLLRAITAAALALEYIVRDAGEIPIRLIAFHRVQAYHDASYLTIH